MTNFGRRYDIDWLRVIAIGLLLIYHVAIGFQPWGAMIWFITTSDTWEALWIPMAMLNVWRIPLLFFVSGMGMYFAFKRRNWKQLLLERSRRILLPYIFGIFAIVPVHVYLWQKYNNMDLAYMPNPGHLWFLGNIFIYVLILLPLLYYLKSNENGKIAQGIKKIFSTPAGLLVIIAAFVAEVLIVKPFLFELYAMTLHGFFLGLLAFFFGFCLVLSGEGFLKMILKWKWILLLSAALLFAVRLLYFELKVPVYLLAVESNLWIFSVLAWGHRYFNHTGKTLRYLSEAAYPVYIVHMIFLYAGSYLIFPLNIAAPIQFILILLFTLLGSFAMYEFVIRRVAILRPLFGLKTVIREKLFVSRESGTVKTVINDQ